MVYTDAIGSLYKRDTAFGVTCHMANMVYSETPLSPKTLVRDSLWYRTTDIRPKIPFESSISCLYNASLCSVLKPSLWPVYTDSLRLNIRVRLHSSEASKLTNPLIYHPRQWKLCENILRCAPLWQALRRRFESTLTWFYCDNVKNIALFINELYCRLWSFNPL